MPAPDASNPIEAVRARLDGGRKWAKYTIGDWGGQEGSVCLRGARLSADVPLADEYLLVDVAAEQFPERMPTYFRTLPAFNDHPDTTWADVDLVLDKAARKWDAGGQVTTTATALRFAANLIDSLPGIPTPFVTVSGPTVTITFKASEADERQRMVAVDAVAALTGLTPAPGMFGDADRYGAMGTVGELVVLVFASPCVVVVPA